MINVLEATTLFSNNFSKSLKTLFFNLLKNQCHLSDRCKYEAVGQDLIFSCRSANVNHLTSSSVTLRFYVHSLAVGYTPRETNVNSTAPTLNRSCNGCFWLFSTHSHVICNVKPLTGKQRRTTLSAANECCVCEEQNELQPREDGRVPGNKQTTATRRNSTDFGETQVRLPFAARSITR